MNKSAEVQDLPLNPVTARLTGLHFSCTYPALILHFSFTYERRLAILHLSCTFLHF